MDLLCPLNPQRCSSILGGEPPNFAEFDRVVRGMLNRISTEPLGEQQKVSWGFHLIPSCQTTIEWASAQVPPTPLYLGGTVGRERERETERERERERWMDGWIDR